MMEKENTYITQAREIIYAYARLNARKFARLSADSLYTCRRTDPKTDPKQLSEQSQKLRDAALNLKIALEKMRVANQKLAERMAEHKHFFEKNG